MKFSVEKCTASVNGGFVVTLRAEGTEDEHGFYSKGIKRFAKNRNDLELGLNLDLNLDEYTEYSQQGIYVDPETGEERKYTNVWLMPKG